MYINMIYYQDSDGGTFLLNCIWDEDELEENLASMKVYSRT